MRKLLFYFLLLFPCALSAQLSHEHNNPFYNHIKRDSRSMEDCDEEPAIYFTPQGSPMEIKICRETDTLDLTEVDINYFKSLFPLEWEAGEIELLCPANALYICHSFAWAMADGSPTCNFLSEGDSSIFILDGSYEETTEAFAERAHIGDWAHSMVKSPTVPGKYESKMSTGALFRHYLDILSSPGMPTPRPKFYRKRCITEFKNRTLGNSVSMAYFSRPDTNLTNTTFRGCESLVVQATKILSGSHVNFHAPEFILFQADFHAEAGSVMTISIEENIVAPPPPPEYTPPPQLIQIISNDSHAGSKFAFNFYPNPNLGTFQIETNFPLSDVASLKVVNSLGAPVYETQNLASNEIQLLNAGSGLYFVVIILKNGTVLTQKMMVQR